MTLGAASRCVGQVVTRIGRRVIDPGPRGEEVLDGGLTLRGRQRLPVVDAEPSQALAGVDPSARDFDPVEHR